MLMERKPDVGKNVQLVRAFNGQVCKARVDPNKIKQVFWNLCDNAIRAMPKGGTLTVGIERIPDSLRISFRDTGVGLEPPHAPRYSNRCNRISRVAPVSDLPSCTRLFRLITDASPFSAKKRKARSLWSSSRASNEVLCQQLKPLRKMSVARWPHILVVDDEKSICELLREITFRKEGHRVEVVHNVEGAKRKLESSLFDIVISDVRMPGQTGVELLRFTREVAPDAYFVLITGVPSLETAIAAANEGANRYVIKDHDLAEQLRVAVREVTENLRWKKEAGYLRRELRRLTGLDISSGKTRR